MTNTSTITVRQLGEIVQHNCHISDARHARDYSLCIYLLKMREFYRWEQGFSFRDPLPKGPLGEWLTEREALWEGLEEQEFHSLPLANATHGPFDSERINRELSPQGLVYSGGYCGAKPHFFLAELERIEESEGTRIYLSGREWARELTAPPAMSLGSTVFLRRESLRRMLWEMLEEWGWQDPQRAIARAAALFDFRHHFESAMDAMAEQEITTLLQHELGEVAIGRELGPEWEVMLSALPRSRAEYQLRAIRDHLVDCRRTLPWLLAEGRDASLHLYMANFTTMRKAIFPALTRAYEKWLNGDNGKALHETISHGADHWQLLAVKALEIFRQRGNEGRELLQGVALLDREITL